MVFEAHCMSFPFTELSLFNYAKVKTVFPFYGTFKINAVLLNFMIIKIYRKKTMASTKILSRIPGFSIDYDNKKCFLSIKLVY